MTKMRAFFSLYRHLEETINTLRPQKHVWGAKAIIKRKLILFPFQISLTERESNRARIASNNHINNFIAKQIKTVHTTNSYNYTRG